jgi:hypothetical protein
VPTLIDPSETWRILGGNVDGLRPYSNMAALITVAEILRALQAETIAFSETNVYTTASDKFETTYRKPRGTVCGALRKMVHRVVDSGRDDIGCGRWSYITYAAKEG